MIEFIKEATIGNQHAFWHFAGGMFFYAVFSITPILWRFPFRAVMALAGLFEIIELYNLGSHIAIANEYGSVTNWLADTTGDILLALVGGFILWIIMSKK